MADNNKIITAMAVQNNPRIRNSGTTDLETFSIEDRTEDLKRYWVPLDIPERRRRLFPIEYWQLDRLMKKTGQVALVVKNIDDPNKVTAKWVSFSADRPPVLPDSSACFVLTQLYYDGIIAELDLGSVSHSIGGLKRIKRDSLNSNFIVALLGKNLAGDFTLYLQNASASLIDEDPGGFNTSPGGEGVGGVKLKFQN